MTKETLRSNPYSVGLRLVASLAAGAVGGWVAYNIGDARAETASAQAHFAVTCPSGGKPSIIEVAHSGALPIDPASSGDRFGWAVVRLACAGGDEAPVIVQDTQNGGDCLGYGQDSHLVVEAIQPGKQGPEFFVASQPEIGVAGSSDLVITKAQLHHHSLEDPYEKAEYDANHCGQ